MYTFQMVMVFSRVTVPIHREQVHTAGLIMIKNKVNHEPIIFWMKVSIRPVQFQSLTEATQRHFGTGVCITLIKDNVVSNWWSGKNVPMLNLGSTSGSTVPNYH